MPAESRPTGERLILLTGATGYIGGRMIPILESGGEKIRCLVRHPLYLKGRAGPGTEVVQEDLCDRDSFAGALEGVDIAFCFMHCMGSESNFKEQERQAAEAAEVHYPGPLFFTQGSQLLAGTGNPPLFPGWPRTHCFSEERQHRHE
jgi:uncharacterized protein YbjT (DUF2867 family)